MSEWRECKLGDAPLEIIDGDRGNNYPPQNEFKDIGYCLFLSTKNVRYDGFDFSECQFISKERDELLRKGKLQRDDLVLTTRGTVGNVGFFNSSVKYENIRINSGMVIIRPDKNNLLPRFNYYLFRKLQSDFLTYTSGSAQPQLPIKDLNEIRILLPPLPEQRAIAAVLSSLDDKIDLLHRQNKTLEAMAEALFRQWFVEPCKDGLPEGWREGKIPDEFAFTMGQSPVGTSFNEDEIGIPMFQGNADFGFRFPSERVYTTEPTRFAEPLDTLVSVRAPVGEQNMALVKCCIGRGVAAFRYSANKDYYTYTYFKIRSLMSEIKRFNDEGTVFGSIGKSDFEALDIIIPPQDLIEDFEMTAKPINDKVIENCYQIRTLEKLRDTLLPKLMSGEVRVKV
ncbi:restriction endonuclease subunit S [Gracilinema caldarium]|uniref:Restriction modification system DNA specificity domain protein n=1 Tax=Gracilinema caldarium (strain ATCC 51460 / DSM 7334 / H1) TaxID=744872 RepID=F8F104_GRAC1|nr:restriction endonuclease subunit S [Gracilinema caldarium]AEJ20794.1 restriction modification system DNA specificity domain protein [Gracilinema caldarium DSM 7334]